MYGKGLLIGLGITMRHFIRNFFGGCVTEQYPERRPVLPQRFRGALMLEPEKCIACGNCVNACPNSAIKITSVRDEQNKRHLTGYQVNLLYCLFCGLCVEACPQNCLRFSHEFELATWNRADAILDLYARASEGAGTEPEPTLKEAGG